MLEQTFAVLCTKVSYADKADIGFYVFANAACASHVQQVSHCDADQIVEAVIKTRQHMPKPNHSSAERRLNQK